MQTDRWSLLLASRRLRRRGAVGIDNWMTTMRQQVWLFWRRQIPLDRRVTMITEVWWAWGILPLRVPRLLTELSMKDRKRPATRNNSTYSTRLAQRSKWKLLGNRNRTRDCFSRRSAKPWRLNALSIEYSRRWRSSWSHHQVQVYVSAARIWSTRRTLKRWSRSFTFPTVCAND